MSVDLNVDPGATFQHAGPSADGYAEWVPGKVSIGARRGGPTGGVNPRIWFPLATTPTVNSLTLEGFLALTSATFWTAQIFVGFSDRAPTVTDTDQLLSAFNGMGFLFDGDTDNYGARAIAPAAMSTAGGLYRGANNSATGYFALENNNSISRFTGTIELSGGNVQLVNATRQRSTTVTSQDATPRVCSVGTAPDWLASPPTWTHFIMGFLSNPGGSATSAAGQVNLDVITYS